MKIHPIRSIILALLATAMLHQPSIAERTCDPALATTVTAAMFGHKEHRLVLIDVRSPKEFERCHIPGSLNIALHAIKTKPFLKTKPIVLVNNGYVLSPLARTCRSVNRAGFRATIMSGGLVAWKAKGGRLVGDPFARQYMNRILPQCFVQENEYAHQVVITTSETPSPQDESFLAQARHLPLLKDKQAIEELKKIMRSNSSEPFFTLLIVSGSDNENTHIQRKLSAAGIHQAFYIQGGRQGFDKHQQYKELARRPKQMRMHRTDGCSTCPQER